MKSKLFRFARNLDFIWRGLHQTLQYRLELCGEAFGAAVHAGIVGMDVVGVEEEEWIADQCETVEEEQMPVGSLALAHDAGDAAAVGFRPLSVSMGKRFRSARFSVSVVEDAVIAWLESLGYAIKHLPPSHNVATRQAGGPKIAPGGSKQTDCR